MSINYNEASIKSLKNEEQVRKRPAVIFGTNDVKGCAHGIVEILSNAIDEASEGYGNKIEIGIGEDNSVSIRDYGRGVPMGWNEEEKQFNWYLVFCTLYAGGKYDENAYSASLGLNGLGATATQYASEWFQVDSFKNKKKSTMQFRKGVPYGEFTVTDTDEENGTLIQFKPDLEVFTSIDVSSEFYLDTIRRQAMLCSNVQFELKYKHLNKIVLHYPDGAKGFIDIAFDKRMIDTITFEGQSTGIDREGEEPYTAKLGVALNFSRHANLLEAYHNTGWLPDFGVTADALFMSLIKVFEEYAKKNGKLNKSDKILVRDIESLLIAVCITSCPGGRSMFQNQTKTALGNPFIGLAFKDFVIMNLSRWVDNNKEKADRVLTEILANKKAREEADKVSKKVVQSLSKEASSFGNKPKKFVECRSKSNQNSELFIVEGDSALGSCKQARNSDFQAIMPIRGKILNCLKEEPTRIFSSDIIVDLMRVLGCGVELKSKYIKNLPVFNLKNLRWQKVIICTDADSDGMQIRCLILAMIYRLCPTILKEGRVYIAETPLFEIEAKKQIFFAYSEPEKVHILSELAKRGYEGNKVTLKRSKGLGENEPEMMSASTMHPDTRRLVPIQYPEDETKLAFVFNALLGDDLENRRYMIEEYFNTYDNK